MGRILVDVSCREIGPGFAGNICILTQLCGWCAYGAGWEESVDPVVERVALPKTFTRCLNDVLVPLGGKEDQRLFAALEQELDAGRIDFDCVRSKLPQF